MTDCQPLRDLEDIRRIVTEHCFTTDHTCDHDRQVGIELETFPVRLGADGPPIDRIPIAQLHDLLDQPLSGAAASAAPGADPAWTLVGGGSLTFEPGGQLEHSTAPHPGPAGALAELDALAGTLAAALQPHGGALAAAGLDVWTGGRVPQQLTGPRYPAMAAYLARRGPYGAVMMRDSCALQVNLDLGPPGERAERWLVANLVAPLACATFAASPAEGAVSGRALAWQRLDPTRTGFPAALVSGRSDDPVEHLTGAALAADVLLVRRAGRWVSGRPGWRFADWLRAPHPDHGAPTEDDLRYHLTTLFTEVRPRGFLELRSVDALPVGLRDAPVLLLAGAIDDATARARIRAVLEPYRARLPGLWCRAATVGVADPAVCALAVEVWSSALQGAARFQPGRLPPGALTRTEAFLDRFTLRGRCPADELRAALADGPPAALAWATTPVDTPAPR